MYKEKEYAWESLKDVAEFYHMFYRILRLKYKWSPHEVDSLNINRILRIYEETLEDIETQNNSMDEEDFE